jgi:hypothetical protein
MAGPLVNLRTAPTISSTAQNNTMPDTKLVVEDEQATKCQAELTRLQEMLGLSREDGDTATLEHCTESSKLIRE